MRRPWPTGGCCTQKKSLQVSEKYSILKNPSSGGRVVPCRRTDRATHDEAIVAVCNFANAPKSSVSNSRPLLQGLFRQMIAVCSGMGKLSLRQRNETEYLGWIFNFDGCIITNFQKDGGDCISTEILKLMLAGLRMRRTLLVGVLIPTNIHL